MAECESILKILADGQFHSGQAISDQLGCSRTAVWKRMQALIRTTGLEVQAVRGRGYRLCCALDLLDTARIQREFTVAQSERLMALVVLDRTASTNALAMAAAPTEFGRGRLWVAEYQTAGRGRRGRSWVSSYAGGLPLSLAWRFDLPMAKLSGLSLAVGVVVAEVLAALGVQGVQLKWPNDIHVGGCKLAGILVEVTGEANGPCAAAIGVGINVAMPVKVADTIDQPWVDLKRLGLEDGSRNRLAGRLGGALMDACVDFGNAGLDPFIPRWRAFDGLCGAQVRLSRGDQCREGIYRGIGPSGAMLLEGPDGVTSHDVGEISLRYSANRS